MKNKLKSFVLSMMLLIIGGVLLVGCVERAPVDAPSEERFTEVGEVQPQPQPQEHVHTFSQSNNYCAECKSYIIKGAGSQYLQSGQQPDELGAIIANATPVDGFMNIIISGAVEYDENLQNSTNEPYHTFDLSKGAHTVNIVGEGNSASVTLVGLYASKYNSGQAKLYFENLTLNSNRNLNQSQAANWEWYHMSYNSPEIVFKNCIFTEGCHISPQTKAEFDNCEFNISGNHYSIWFGAKGYTSYTSYVDNLEEVVVKNCTFNSDRGIKVLTSGANIEIKNNTFNNLTGKPGIVLDSNTGNLNTVVIYENTFNNCKKGTWNGPNNTLYSETYNTEYFSVTETASVVKNEEA